MRRRLGLVAVLVVVVAAPALAQRGGGRGNATVRTPYGPVFNPALSPEWRQAGGNPMAYQQIMRQKMLLAQQKAMQGQYKALQKQQADFNKWYSEQKAKRDKGEPTDPAFERMFGKAKGEGEGDAKAEMKAPTRKTKAQFRAEMRKKAEAQQAGFVPGGGTEAEPARAAAGGQATPD